MDTIRIIAAVLTGLITLRGIYLTWKQLSSLQSNKVIVLFKLTGWLTLLVCTGFSLARASWRLLGLGFVLYGMVGALGFDLAMIIKSPPARRHALLGLLQNLPWWTGVLIGLIQAQWIPLLIGIGVSVLLYLVLSPARSNSATAAGSH